MQFDYPGNVNIRRIALIVCALSLSATWGHAESRVHPGYLHPSNEIVRSQDRFCGPYSVWHALNWCGRPAPIDTLVKQMQPDNGAVSTMAGIVSTLKLHGVEASAARLDLDSLDKITVPFIAYLRRRDDHIGHFLFCLPIGENKYLIADGIKEPRKVDVLDMKGVPGSRLWDGTVVLMSHNSADKAVLWQHIAVGCAYLVIASACVYALGLWVSRYRLSLVPGRR